MKTTKLDTLRSLQYEANIERLGDHSNTCICCGKRTAEKHFIQMTTSGDLIDSTTEVDDSQGFFPIGPECLKKFNKLAKTIQQ
ncbi:MAG: hypothetical protein EOM67_12425 [Spirochaetia bacterium]|nr:hypothetical protein [Spirochaetia bacterium]